MALHGLLHPENVQLPPELLLRLLLPEPPKVCKMMAFIAVIMGLVRAIILHTFGVQVLLLTLLRLLRYNPNPLLHLQLVLYKDRTTNPQANFQKPGALSAVLRVGFRVRREHGPFWESPLVGSWSLTRGVE